jgi:hypothetical protein
MKFLFIGKKLGCYIDSYLQFMIKLHKFLFFFTQFLVVSKSTSMYGRQQVYIHHCSLSELRYVITIQRKIKLINNQFTFHKTFIFINNDTRTSNYIACLIEKIASLKHKGGGNQKHIHIKITKTFESIGL